MNHIIDAQEMSTSQKNEIATQVLDNQKRELELKQQELVLREKELNLTHEQAMKSLDLQAQDRRETRSMLLEGHGKQLRWHLWFGVLFAIMIVALVWLGQATLAGDLAKIAAGLIAGYWAGKGKGSNSQQKNEE